MRGKTFIVLITMLLFALQVIHCIVGYCPVFVLDKPYHNRQARCLVHIRLVRTL